MITKALLRETRTKNSKLAGPIMPSEMPNIKVDMRGMLDYAKKHQISVEDLTDDERAKFVYLTTPTGKHNVINY